MFLHYLSEYQTWGYIIIFLGMMIEGDILLFTTGFLVHRGYFELDKTLLIVFLGVMIGDNLWYALGEILRGKKTILTNFINRIAEPFDNHLQNKTARTIFISKFAYGFHRPILLRAGSLHLSFKKFFEGDITASIIWIILIFGIGYLSSASFLTIRRYLRYTELTLFFGLIFFILISHFLRYISKKEL